MGRRFLGFLAIKYHHIFSFLHGFCELALDSKWALVQPRLVFPTGLPPYLLAWLIKCRQKCALLVSFLQEAYWELIGLRCRNSAEDNALTEYDHAVALRLLAQKVLSWEVSEICRMLVFFFSWSPEKARRESAWSTLFHAFLTGG